MENQELSTRHFTTSAIHSIEQLCPRAADRSMTAEVTEQTALMLALWSILRWEWKVGLVALERMGGRGGRAGQRCRPRESTQLQRPFHHRLSADEYAHTRSKTEVAKP